MRSVAAKVTSKGQITIPLEVREQLGLRAGDHVLFRLGEDVDHIDEVAMESERGRTHSKLARIPDIVSLGGTMHPPKGLGRRSWTEIRAAAWDAEVRRRR